MKKLCLIRRNTRGCYSVLRELLDGMIVKQRARHMFEGIGG
jgi:hypothetical protein